MMTNILVYEGYQVGKFISPHLIEYNERISINHNHIKTEEMECLIQQIDPLVQQYEQKYQKKITLFELETTMTILYFAQQKCDFVVLEVGMGGLYDCTNIVTPIVSMITSIGMDHMAILGNTLEEIATQKAGIIIFIVSILKSKDYKAILHHLMINPNDHYIFTSGNDESRYIEKEELYKEAQKIRIYQTIQKQELISAIHWVKENAKGQIVFVVGSFYIYGTVIENIR